MKTTSNPFKTTQNWLSAYSVLMAYLLEYVIWVYFGWSDKLALNEPVFLFYFWLGGLPIVAFFAAITGLFLGLAKRLTTKRRPYTS